MQRRENHKKNKCYSGRNPLCLTNVDDGRLEEVWANSGAADDLWPVLTFTLLAVGCRSALHLTSCWPFQQVNPVRLMEDNAERRRCWGLIHPDVQQQQQHEDRFTTQTLFSRLKPVTWCMSDIMWHQWICRRKQVNFDTAFVNNSDLLAVCHHPDVLCFTVSHV